MSSGSVPASGLVQVAQAATSASSGFPDASGAWGALNRGRDLPSYQSCVTITQAGAKVTGVVKYENVPGRTTPGTLNGDISVHTLSLTFSNQVSKGRLTLVLSSDGNTATGTWTVEEIQKGGIWQKASPDIRGYTGEVSLTRRHHRSC